MLGDCGGYGAVGVAMSDTPRTDIVQQAVYAINGDLKIPNAVFRLARTLERECAALTAENAAQLAELHAISDALERAEERCALRRPDGSIIWETLSDPLWGARRRADGMEVFDYLVISLDKEQR